MSVEMSSASWSGSLDITVNKGNAGQARLSSLSCGASEISMNDVGVGVTMQNMTKQQLEDVERVAGASGEGHYPVSRPCDG